jgi:hypothetical protein
LNATAEDRVATLLAEGWECLRQGRAREAADAFGRVLLQDPAEPRAREGLERARAGLAEQSRELDAMLAEAHAAADSGDLVRARALLEDVIRLGGDRDRAAAILDRLRDSGATLVLGAGARTRSVLADLAGERHAPSWSRRALVAGWAIVFALLAGVVSLSWDHLLSRLVRTPEPSSSIHESASHSDARVTAR